MLPRNLLWLVLIAPASTLAATAAPTAVDRTVAAEPRGTVSVTNVSGSVRIVGAERRDVRITGTLGRGVERLDVTREGSTVRVRVILPESRETRRDAAAQLTLAVPAGSALEVSTVSASIEAKGVSGAADLRSVSGEITLEGAGPRVDVQTISGDLRIVGAGAGAGAGAASAPSGKARITSVSGDIDARRLAGRLEIQSVSGDIFAEVSPITELRARSTSGDVRLDGSIVAKGDVEIESVSGDVDLAAVPASGFTINAAAFSGEIRTCFGATPASGRGPGSRLESKVGEGTARVKARTLSGDIVLCDRERNRDRRSAPRDSRG